MKKLLVSLMSAFILTSVSWARSPEFYVEIMCIPVTLEDGKIRIVSLCDAKEINQNEKLIVDGNGCAEAGQQLAGAEVTYAQTAAEIWGAESIVASRRLPLCQLYDIATFPLLQVPNK